MSQKCCLKSEEKTLCICSYEELLLLLGKKWAVLILRIINTSGPIGYNAIFDQISKITPKAFNDKLKILETKQLVKRAVISKRPLRVQYSLTDGGKDLLSRLNRSLLKK